MNTYIINNTINANITYIAIVIYDDVSPKTVNALDAFDWKAPYCAITSKITFSLEKFTGILYISFGLSFLDSTPLSISSPVNDLRFQFKMYSCGFSPSFCMVRLMRMYERYG